MLIILTGEKGAGKSTLLLQLAHSLKKPCGVVCARPTPHILEANLFPSFEKITMADEGGAGGDECVKFCSYYFKNHAVAKTNEVIAEAANTGTLLVDEIGFWELAGGGYAQNMEMIAARTLVTILSVKKTALSEVCAKWELKPSLIADVGLLGPEKAYGIIRMAAVN
jgi:nucleoside-triphosphatase THEP1